jgi:hypothetical protein
VNISIPYVQNDKGYFKLIEELGEENIRTAIEQAIFRKTPIITFMKRGWATPMRMEIKICGEQCWAYWKEDL